MLQHLLSPAGRGNQGEGQTMEDLADTLSARWAGTILGRVARIVEPSTPIRQPWEDYMASEHDKIDTEKVITSLKLCR